MIKYCKNCGKYTLKNECSNCGEKTIKKVPAKFSVKKDYSIQRLKIKRYL